MSGSRSKRLNKGKPAAEPGPHIEALSVGTIVESLKPSHLWSVLTISVAVIVGVFTLTVWIMRTSSDIDMKMHLLQDQEEKIKVLEERDKLQKEIDKKEAEKEFWKGKCSKSKSCDELPPKEPVYLKIAPNK